MEELYGSSHPHAPESVQHQTHYKGKLLFKASKMEEKLIDVVPCNFPEDGHLHGA